VIAIHKYYRNIHENLNLLEGINSAAFGPIFDMKILRLLKHRVNGATLTFMNMGNWDASLTPFEEIVMALSYVWEELLLDPQFQAHGGHYVVDLSDFGFSHLWHLNYHKVKFGVTSTMVSSEVSSLLNPKMYRSVYALKYCF